MLKLRGKFIYHTFQEVNKKGADQTVHLRRLVCAFVVCMQQSQVLLCHGPYDCTSYTRGSGWGIMISEYWPFFIINSE